MKTTARRQFNTVTGNPGILSIASDEFEWPVVYLGIYQDCETAKVEIAEPEILGWLEREIRAVAEPSNSEFRVCESSAFDEVTGDGIKVTPPKDGVFTIAFPIHDQEFSIPQSREGRRMAKELADDLIEARNLLCRRRAAAQRNTLQEN